MQIDKEYEEQSQCDAQVLTSRLKEYEEQSQCDAQVLTSRLKLSRI